MEPMSPIINEDVAMGTDLLADCLLCLHFSHEDGDTVFLYQVTRCIIPDDNSLIRGAEP
jgi:hypothetical protein